MEVKWSGTNVSIKIEMLVAIKWYFLYGYLTEYGAFVVSVLVYFAEMVNGSIPVYGW